MIVPALHILAAPGVNAAEEKNVWLALSHMVRTSHCFA
jgi:hypothetical protein